MNKPPACHLEGEDPGTKEQEKLAFCPFWLGKREGKPGRALVTSAAWNFGGGCSLRLLAWEEHFVP